MKPHLTWAAQIWLRGKNITVEVLIYHSFDADHLLLPLISNGSGSTFINTPRGQTELINCQTGMKFYLFIVLNWFDIMLN